MTVTGLIDTENIEEELVVFLRNSDILTVSTRGVTTVTEEFDGNDSDTEFTVSNTNIKNVRSVTIGGTAQTFGTDYTVNYQTATITFSTAPVTGTDNVDIQYDYGSTDKIVASFNKSEIKHSSYPLISVDTTSMVTEDGSLDGTMTYNGFLISVYVYTTGRRYTNTYIKDIREALLENKKGFYYLRYITPQSMSPMLPVDGLNQKVFLRTLELNAPLNEEVVS